MKRVFLIIFISIFLLTACNIKQTFEDTVVQTDTGQADENTALIIDKGPVEGGVLRLFTTIPDTYHPLFTQNKYMQLFSHFIFESMIELDEEQNPKPLLAVSWNIEENGLIWGFELKSDVFWQDGALFSANDVIFTFETIINAELPCIYKNNLLNVRDLISLDSRHVKVILNTPDLEFVKKLIFPIIPAHYYAGDVKTVCSLSKTPVGSGPYMFHEQKENKIILKKNPKWWNARKGKPYIGEVDWIIFTDSKMLMDAFQKGEVDIAYVDDGDFSIYEKRHDIIMKTYRTNQLGFILCSSRNPVLRNAGIRDILFKMLDMQILASKVFNGEVVPYKDRKPYSFAEALEELSLYGIFYSEKEKCLKNKGNKLIFRLLVNKDEDKRVDTAEFIKSTWETFGIKTEIIKISKNKIQDAVKNNNFDLVLMDCIVPIGMDLTKLRNQISKKVGQNISSIYVYPLYWKKKAVIYKYRIRGDKHPFYWNLLGGFYDWYIVDG